MKFLLPLPHRELHPLARLRAWHRLLAATAIGLASGMTSQVADVGIASPLLRRLMLVHGLISFAFNLMVLALTLNLVASALG